MFNFKTFKTVSLTTTNSIIVTASLLLNLYTVLLLKTNDQRRQLDILIKDAIIWHKMPKGQATKEEVCKSNSTLLALKHSI